MADRSHRVYTVTDQTRSLFIAKRERESATNEEVLAAAIEKQAAENRKVATCFRAQWPGG